MPGAFAVNVAELVRRPGTQKEVHLVGPATSMQVVDSRVADGASITADLVLESLTDGIVVTGTVTAPWEGSCRRCLTGVGGELAVDVRELYQQKPTAEEAFPFHGDRIDLEPMVREAILLELPLAPVCRPDCAGLCPVCGTDRNATDCDHRPDVTDPRWAVLDDLLETGKPDPGAN